MEIIRDIAYFLVFPGFLFTATVGLLASWVDRKVTARIQWRVGPPWYQCFVDFVKLLGKETLVPQGSMRSLFLFTPIMSVASITLVSTFLWIMNGNPQRGFIGDAIVILYLLAIPAISVILGGFASANPLASIGSSREMKLMLAYELPFVIALTVPVVQSGGSIQIGQILAHQTESGMVAASWSGALAFAVCILCIQAKLTLVPFDMPEAETEIVGGPYIEYSGSALALYKLGRSMMLFTLPVFLITMFMGGIRPSSPMAVLWGTLKYSTILVITVLLRNTNPRLRIDQAIRFFWGPVTVLATIAAFLALKGY